MTEQITQVSPNEDKVSALAARLQGRVKELEAQLAKANEWLVIERKSVNELDEHLQERDRRIEKAEAQLAREDNPDFDATDAAHPAWWRGHDHTAQMFEQKVTRLKAQLAEANAALDYKIEIATDDFLATILTRAEKAEAGAAKMFEDVKIISIREAVLRDVITKVEEWLSSDESPLYALWETGDICSYDDNPLETWEGALEELRDHSIDPVIIGHGAEWPAVTLYREILAAMSPKAPAEPAAE